MYYAVQRLIGRPITTAATGVDAWRKRPDWYIVSRQYRTIGPDFQRFMAKRMNASTTEIDSSHVWFSRQPRAEPRK
jgi:hypothetical protein